MVVSIAAIGATVAVSPLVLAQAFGTIGLLCLFAVILLFFLSALESFGKKLGLSFIYIFIALALLWSLLDVNDNHDVRNFKEQLPRTTEPAAPFKIATSDEAFVRWWESRQDRPKFSGRRYPVYIVAAQGGGVYAAMHTANFLSRVQDRCPGFGHHLLAVSGVSGGSVGTTAFAAMTLDYAWSKISPDVLYGCYTDGAIPRPHFRDATEDVFRGDLLSPLVAGLLFPDFFQRFLPWPVYDWDRARSLEYAFEGAYRDGLAASRFPVAPSKPLSDPSVASLSSRYREHWNPEQNLHTPALVLNTTETETGERQVISPFTFSGIGLHFLPIWEGAEQSSDNQGTLLDPPMSTAAILSARFPWLTPAASFWNSDNNDPTASPVKIRIVDGGYFENSGVATAVDLVSSILRTAERLQISDQIEINFIVFTSADFDRPRSYGLGELLEPIRTMLNTREARARIRDSQAIRYGVQLWRVAGGGSNECHQT